MVGPSVLIVPAGSPAVAPAGPLADSIRGADASVEVRFADPPGPRAAAGGRLSRVALPLASRSAARELPGLVTLHGAQAVVSDDPAVIRAMATLRRSGGMRVPAVALVTRSSDPAAQAAEGIDLHLLADPGFASVVTRVAPDSRVVAVRGLVDPRYEAGSEREQARRAIGVPEGSPLVVIHGGEEASGDLAGAGEVALAADPAARVVILCGENAERLAELQAWFARAARLRAVGVTDRVPELLAATDVLVETAGGLAVLEASSRGVAVIAYGWRGAGDRQALADALIEALQSPRPEAEGLAGRPSAADEVLAVAGLEPVPA